MKRLIFLIPVGLFAALMAAFVGGLGHDPSIRESALIGKPVPRFDLAGVRPADLGLKSTDLHGQPVLVNVFASWCVACRSEHAMLLYLKREGVVIHGLDWKDQPADGAKWLSDMGDPYQLVGNDLSGRTGIDFGVTGVPETFLIDRHGKVRYKQVGPISPEDWNKHLKPLMDKLRAEP